MTIQQNIHPKSRFRAPGFTLIEMLAVISIVVVLIALSITTGVLVIKRQDVAATKGLVSSLDRALEEYIVENGGTIPPYIDDAYRGVPGPFLKGMGSVRTNDVMNDSSLNTTYLGRMYPRHPDAAVFISQASGTGSVDAIIAGLGDRFLMPTPIFGAELTTGVNEQDVSPSIMDPWGDPARWAASTNDPLVNDWPILDDSAHVIFYVHPSNRLAQALYGECVNDRPYFFSAGPDGMYGTTSQMTANGEIAPSVVVIAGSDGDEDITNATLAVDALEDNIYSYTVGPAQVSDEFNENYR